MRDELEREQLSHSETRDKLSTAQKGAQSSTLMNLELQDYQRSIRSLEEEVASKRAELESTQKEIHTHLDKIEQLKKELGVRLLAYTSYISTHHTPTQSVRVPNVVLKWRQ